METPYKGRATVTDIYNGVEIVVPSNKPALFIFRAIGGVAFIVVFSFITLRPKITDIQGQHIDGFSIFGGCLVGAVLLVTLYQALWLVAGKEVITVADGVLTITKKGTLSKTMRYDLHEATDFRAVKEDEITDKRNMSTIAYTLGVARQGTIKFDYGIETIQFGDLLSQLEGEYILKRLRDKKLIT